MKKQYLLEVGKIYCVTVDTIEHTILQGAIYAKRGEDKSISCPYYTKTATTKYLEIGIIYFNRFYFKLLYIHARFLLNLYI